MKDNFFKGTRERHVGINVVEAFFSARLPRIFLHVKVIMYRTTLHTSERLKGIFFYKAGTFNTMS